MHWRRKWQPTPVFLPGESQGRGAWWAAVYGVAQCQTRLKRLSSSSSSSSRAPLGVDIYQIGQQRQTCCLWVAHMLCSHTTQRANPGTSLCREDKILASFEIVCRCGGMMWAKHRVPSGCLAYGGLSTLPLSLCGPVGSTRLTNTKPSNPGQPQSGCSRGCWLGENLLGTLSTKQGRGSSCSSRWAGEKDE